MAKIQALYGKGLIHRTKIQQSKEKGDPQNEDSNFFREGVDAQQEDSNSYGKKRDPQNESTEGVDPQNAVANIQISWRLIHRIKKQVSYEKEVDPQKDPNSSEKGNPHNV